MKKTIFLFLIQLSFISTIVCQNFKIKGLEIASADLKKSNNSSQDYGDRYTFKEVEQYLVNNKEWRLPTIDELLIMFENRNEIGNMSGDLYLCYGLNEGEKIPDDYSNYSWYKNPGNQSFWVNFYKSGNNLDVDFGNQCYVRLVKVNTKQNDSAKKSREKDSNTKTKSVKNNDVKEYNSQTRITTYSGSYGLSGSTFSNSDIQFQLECSAPFNKARLSSGMKWRYFLNQYSGLNVEGFGRIYTGKESKMFSSNNRLFIQAKIGYGLVKPKEDSFTTQFNFREKSTFSPLAGLGIGYKFILKERIVFDLLLGYHYQSTPKFSSTDIDYTAYQKTKWKDNIASPVEFQWGIGFLIK
jgi:hypothetical protein